MPFVIRGERSAGSASGEIRDRHDVRRAGLAARDGSERRSPQRDRSRTPSANRIVLWILGIAVGGYLVISGLVGVLTHR